MRVVKDSGLGWGLMKRFFMMQVKSQFCRWGSAIRVKLNQVIWHPGKCAAHWRHRILEQMSAIQLTILIGQYALNWHLADRKQGNLTETVKNWQSYWPEIIVLPHPSPRNNIWLKKNPWFDTDVVPALRQQVKQVLNFAEVGVKTS